MKTKNSILITCSLTLLFASGCALYSVVSTDQDSTADFTNYKTYAWLPDKDNSNNELNNQIMRNNIKNYFTHEMVENYGFTANPNTPNILMEFKVTVVNKVKTEEHLVTNTVPNYSTGYPYQNNRYPPNPYSQNQYYTPQPNPYNYNGYNNNYIKTYNSGQNTGYRYQTTYIKDQHNYTQSTITFNMIERERNEMVWTVTAQVDIYDYDNSRQDMQNDIHPAVHKMMKYFPIKRIESRKQKY